MKKENTVNEPTKAMPYDALLAAVVCPNCGSKRIEAFSNGTPRSWWIDGVCVDCDWEFNIASGN